MVRTEDVGYSSRNFIKLSHSSEVSLTAGQSQDRLDVFIVLARPGPTDSESLYSCSGGAAARHSGEDLKSEISTACCSSQDAAAPPEHE